MNLEFLFSRPIVGLILSVVGIIGFWVLYWRKTGEEMALKDPEEKEENEE